MSIRLGDAKVGDRIYSITRYSSDIIVKTITRVTKSQVIFETKKAGSDTETYETKVMRDTGIQVGTGGSDRFSCFSRITWHLVTDEIAAQLFLQVRRRKVRTMIKELDDFDYDNLTADECFEIEKLLVEVTKYKKPKATS